MNSEFSLGEGVNRRLYGRNFSFTATRNTETMLMIGTLSDTRHMYPEAEGLP